MTCYQFSAKPLHIGLGQFNPKLELQLNSNSITGNGIEIDKLKMELEIQWNPSIKATQDGGLSKEVAFMRGKINMIWKEWCVEMDQILQL